MKYFLPLAVMLLLLTNCGKEKLPWDIINQEVKNNMGLVELHDDDFSEDNPFDTIPDYSYKVFVEKHDYNEFPHGRNHFQKEFILELKNDMDDFYYENDELRTKLKCALWHYYYSNHDGYYRVKKGWVRGTRDGASWKIDFHVEYGGRKGDRYEMKSNADYD